MKLKIEKGFTINKEEAETKARQDGVVNAAGTSVSAALS